MSSATRRASQNPRQRPRPRVNTVGVTISPRRTFGRGAFECRPPRRRNRNKWWLANMVVKLASIHGFSSSCREAFTDQHLWKPHGCTTKCDGIGGVAAVWTHTPSDRSATAARTPYGVRLRTLQSSLYDVRLFLLKAYNDDTKITSLNSMFSTFFAVQHSESSSPRHRHAGKLCTATFALMRCGHTAHPYFLAPHLAGHCSEGSSTGPLGIRAFGASMMLSKYTMQERST